MFRKPLSEATQGDRIGICVTQFDPSLLERGVASTPNYLRATFAVVAKVSKISYFKGACNSKAKFHVSLTHETVMATASFFVTTASDYMSSEMDITNEEFEWADQLTEEGNQETDDDHERRAYFVLLEFEKPVTTNNGSLLIASKLDSDINANICRLAFYGNIKHAFHAKEYKLELPNVLKVFKYKSKEGQVERIVNDYELIAKSMFKKEFNLKKIEGMKVKLEATGELGQIAGSFGQSGKVKVAFPSALVDKSAIVKGSLISLRFKKYLYQKTMKQ